MSRLRLNKITTPSSPSANKTELFYASDLAAGTGASSTALGAKDESGNIARIAGFATKDYRLVKVTHVLQGTVSYTPAAGVQALYVECIGAGGAGGGGVTGTTATSAGGGGGGGAYSSKWITGSGVKTSYTVAVGAGGTVGSAGNNPGNVGNDTTFDSPSVCTAKGGAGGLGGGVAATTVGIIAGVLGGAAASGIGDDAWQGSPGLPSIRLSATVVASGAGGDGPLAGGGGLGIIAQAAGNAGTGFGAAGSGGVAFNGGASVAGGAGANGLIRVWEFA